MSELFENPRTPNASGVHTSFGPAAHLIDEAVSGHLSQLYWDWRTTFERDPQASPLQHPDYVLSEIASGTSQNCFAPVLIREPSDQKVSTLGALLPKTVRTSQVGGLGPGWTLQGIRLAGGRFIGSVTSLEQQQRLLACAAQHVTSIGASFLLIEDLDIGSPLYLAAQNQSAHGCGIFATHDFQPRRYVDFPATEAAYWSTFSSRSLSKFRRNLKKFGKTKLERITQIEQIPDFLQAAHQISQQSWQSRQYGLRIRNDDAEMRQMSALAENGLLRSYLWWIEDKPAAFAICNQHGGCFRYEEIAYCAEFGQFSPGRTMLQQIVEDLLRHDSPKVLDFGGGDAEYKQQFANRESRSGSIWLVPPTWRARASITYLKVCRRLRATGRALVKKSGLGTAARQWIRSRGNSSTSASISETVEAAEGMST